MSQKEGSGPTHFTEINQPLTADFEYPLERIDWNQEFDPFAHVAIREIGENNLLQSIHSRVFTLPNGFTVQLGGLMINRDDIPSHVLQIPATCILTLEGSQMPWPSNISELDFYIERPWEVSSPKDKKKIQCRVAIGEAIYTFDKPINLAKMTKGSGNTNGNWVSVDQPTLPKRVILYDDRFFKPGAMKVSIFPF
jgi:hypothetical protein